jgi:hypothetical protein
VIQSAFTAGPRVRSVSLGRGALKIPRQGCCQLATCHAASETAAGSAACAVTARQDRPDYTYTHAALRSAGCYGCYGDRGTGGIWYSDIPSPNTTVVRIQRTMAAERRTMGVIGTPIHPAVAIRSIYRYLSRMSIQKVTDLQVLSVLTMGSLLPTPPPYGFLNLYGACLRASTEDPKN